MEEFENYQCGLLPPEVPPGGEGVLRVLSLAILGPTPDHWDWRDRAGEDWTTSIRNQGPCGSCWAFGTLAAVEAGVDIKANDPDYDRDLSEQYMLSCSPGGCDGWYMNRTLDWMKEHGAIDESCFPYRADDTIPCGEKCPSWDRNLVMVQDWNQVTSDRDSLKNAMIQYGPLPAAMKVYEDFFYYNGGIYRHSWGPFKGWHAITIVGYDESEDYWVCKNSWGTRWGEGGWFRIGFGECQLEKYVFALTVSLDPARSLGNLYLVADSDATGLRSMKVHNYSIDVPGGLESFSVDISDGDGLTLEVCDPSGNLVWSQQGFSDDAWNRIRISSELPGTYRLRIYDEHDYFWSYGNGYRIDVSSDLRNGINLYSDKLSLDEADGEAEVWVKVPTGISSFTLSNWDMEEKGRLEIYRPDGSSYGIFEGPLYMSGDEEWKDLTINSNGHPGYWRLVFTKLRGVRGFMIKVPPPVELHTRTASALAYREIGTNRVQPGGSFTLEAAVHSCIDQDLKFHEEIPHGWKVRRISDDATGFDSSSNTWSWESVEANSIHKLRYRIEVPPDEKFLGLRRWGGEVSNRWGIIDLIEGKGAVIVGKEPAGAPTSVSWTNQDEWRRGTYENARVHNGSVEIGIYPPEPSFDGSRWDFWTDESTEVDDLSARYEGGTAYFFAHDTNGIGGGNEEGEADAYAEDSFYLDSAGVGDETLTFTVRAWSNDFDEGNGSTSLQIGLLKPDGSQVPLWSRTYSTRWEGSAVHLERVKVPSSVLDQTGIYKIRFHAHWYFDIRALILSQHHERFEWRVDGISFGFTKAKHTAEWREMGRPVEWRGLKADARVGKDQSIVATVEVSDDKVNVKDRVRISLPDGTSAFDISALKESRFVRVTTFFTTKNLSESPRLNSYTVTANELPVVDFEYSPSSPHTSDTIQFMDKSMDADGWIKSWSWDFGDGTTSTAQNPTHSYANDGTYIVALTVTDDYGASDNTSKTITVLNVPPTADFTFLPTSPSTADTIQFMDHSSDPDGIIRSWSWDFGDRSSSQIRNPTHSYADAGTFEVTLTVTDDDNADVKVSRTIVVTEGKPAENAVNEPPAAFFTYGPVNPVTGSTVEFNASFSEAGSFDISSYSWEFGDGITAFGKIVYHKYDVEGDYEVTLTVQDEGGQVDSEMKTVRVFEIPQIVESQSPQINITIITSEAPKTVAIENTDVVEVKIWVVKHVSDVGITIQQLTEKPEWVEVLPPDIPYRYFNFVLENITDDDVENVSIKFKVEKSWISKEGIYEDSIKLRRYHPDTGEWRPLTTKKIDEDDEHIYFSASSPSLSVFAVTGSKPSEHLPWVLIGVVAAIVVIAGILVYIKK